MPDLEYSTVCTRPCRCACRTPVGIQTISRFRRVWILKIYCAHHANSQYSALWILRLSANTVICMVRAVRILEFQNEFWAQFSEFRTESWNWQQIWAENSQDSAPESWNCMHCGIDFRLSESWGLDIMHDWRFNQFSVFSALNLEIGRDEILDWRAAYYVNFGDVIDSSAVLMTWSIWRLKWSTRLQFCGLLVRTAVPVYT